MYELTTDGIAVKVTANFLPERSDPGAGRWMFAYTVEIANDSAVQVQLVSRYWHITDANGKVEEVRGPGVVGEQPILAPGDSFTYTSGCPLRTSSGILKGSYRMQSEDGRVIEVRIPAFSLDAPAAQRVLN